MNSDKKRKSFKPIINVIIIFLSIIGVLNTFIGTFLNFIPQYLVGSFYPLFYLIIISFALLSLFEVKMSKLRITTLISGLVLFSLATLVITAIGFDQAPTLTSFNVQVKEINNFIHVYNNLPHFFVNPDPGVIGYGLYFLLFGLIGKTLSLVIAIIFLFISIGLVFYPLFKVVIYKIVYAIKEKRRRKKVIFNAKKVPTIKRVDESEINLNREKVKGTIHGEEFSLNNVSTPVFGAPNSSIRSNESITFGTAKEAKFDFDDFTSHYKNEVIEESIIDNTNSIIEDIAVNPELELEDHELAVEQEKITVEEDYMLSNLLDDEKHEKISEPVFNKELEFYDVVNTKNDGIYFDEVPNSQVYSHNENINEEELIVAQQSSIEEIQINKEEDDLTGPFVFAQKDTFVAPATPSREIVEEELEKVIQPVVKKKIDTYKNYIYPPLDLLYQEVSNEANEINTEQAERNLIELNQALIDLNANATAESYTIGPSVTRFDIRMAADASVSGLTKLVRDLRIRLGGVSSRFEPVVTGKQTSGFEVANVKATTVNFIDCIAAIPTEKKYKMHVPFGKNVNGEIIHAAYDAFPHLLVAGGTGSGKSVYVHSILMTLIMRNTPDELKLLLIDPKRVEMSIYKDLPHLLCPIVKDPGPAKIALNKLVDEMESRYKIFEDTACNKISSYNEYAEEEGLPLMPKILVVIDEYADLYENEKDVAIPILKLAQKSRAAGIHLLVATQRPSVQVVTGQIKANLGTRVALKTASQVDSQTIIGGAGAEELLGYGDMLVDCSEISRSGLVRIQGAFVRDKELRSVTNFIRERYPVDYDPGFLDLSERSSTNASIIGGSASSIVDEAYDDVVEFTRTLDRISISKIQMNFKFGYPRARGLYDMMLANGVIKITDDSNSSRGAEVVYNEPLSPSEKEIRDFNDR